MTARLHPAEIDFVAAEAQRVIAGSWRGASAQQRIDAQQQFAQVERLGQVVVGLQFESADAILVIGAGTEHEHRSKVAAPAQFFEHLEAVLARQHDVEDQQVDAALRHAFERARAGQHVFGVVGLVAEVVTQHLAELAFVFGDQDPATHEVCSKGRRTVNELPWSRPALSAVTDPPWE